MSERFNSSLVCLFLFGKWCAVQITFTSAQRNMTCCASFSFFLSKAWSRLVSLLVTEGLCSPCTAVLEKHSTINFGSYPFDNFASPLVKQPRSLRSCSILEHVLA